MTPEFLERYGFGFVTAELHALLFPGYLLVPYIGEPFGTLVIPFIVASLRIKSDPSITVGTAVSALAAPEADLINPPYVDLVINCTLVLCTLLVPGKSWLLLVQLSAAFTLLYWIYKVRLLRVHRRMVFSHGSLDSVATLLWLAPLLALTVQAASALFSSPVTFAASSSLFCLTCSENVSTHEMSQACAVIQQCVAVMFMCSMLFMLMSVFPCHGVLLN